VVAARRRAKIVAGHALAYSLMAKPQILCGGLLGVEPGHHVERGTTMLGQAALLARQILHDPPLRPGERAECGRPRGLQALGGAVDALEQLLVDYDLDGLHVSNFMSSHFDIQLRVRL